MKKDKKKYVLSIGPEDEYRINPTGVDLTADGIIELLKSRNILIEDQLSKKIMINQKWIRLAFKKLCNNKTEGDSLLIVSLKKGSEIQINVKFDIIGNIAIVDELIVFFSNYQSLRGDRKIFTASYEKDPRIGEEKKYFALPNKTTTDIIAVFKELNFLTPDNLLQVSEEIVRPFKRIKLSPDSDQKVSGTVSIKLIQSGSVEVCVNFDAPSRFRIRREQKKYCNYSATLREVYPSNP